MDDAEVLAAVQRACAQWPYTASVRDVQHELCLTSPSSAYRALVRLRDKGLVAWDPNRHRTIRPTRN